jgi:Ala-tRNA(Pro) deacylase
MTDIYQFLDQHGIGYERHDHPPVFTCEEAQRLVPPLDAAPTKNLFLRDDKGRRHFLVSVGFEKSVDLKKLSSVIGSSKLSLASPERLKEHLGVDPGAVTLLGVVNDPDHAVEVIVDENLWNSQAFQCHPLVNTSTLVVSREGMERLFGATGHKIRVVCVPGRQS